MCFTFVIVMSISLNWAIWSSVMLAGSREDMLESSAISMHVKLNQQAYLRMDAWNYKRYNRIL